MPPPEPGSGPSGTPDIPESPAEVIVTTRFPVSEPESTPDLPAETDRPPGPGPSDPADEITLAGFRPPAAGVYPGFHPRAEIDDSPREPAYWPADEVANVPPGGSFPGSAAQTAWRVPPPPRNRIKAILLNLGDLPVNVVYGVGAAILTVIAVILIFAVFSGDEPQQPVGLAPRSQAPASPLPTPTPTAVVSLPPVPAGRLLITLPGKGTEITGVVSDTKARVAYPRLGEPWATASAVPPFTAVQRVDAADDPPTLIASRLFPGAAPKSLATDADLRKAAASLARWVVRNHHPPGSTLAWTASERLGTGRGWVLGFRVTYRLADGVRHTSEAAVAVVDAGRARPGMLMVTIPDSRKELWRDLNTVVWNARSF
ncbi:hypothetical protein [Sinosporangium siamense]|nr:hypothetical protein [Sinosporangium siamense]